LAAGPRQFIIPPFQFYQPAFLASRIPLVEALRTRRSARPFPVVLYSFNVGLLNTLKVCNEKYRKKEASTEKSGCETIVQITFSVKPTLIHSKIFRQLYVQNAFD